jgi:hypothetical protein
MRTIRFIGSSIKSKIKLVTVEKFDIFFAIQPSLCKPAWLLAVTYIEEI